MRPRLALTLGDPAGIGPEIVLKALASSHRPDAAVSVFGPLAALRERARRFGLRPPESLDVRLVDVPGEGKLPMVIRETSETAVAPRP